MATSLNVQAWSTTPASNDGADSTIGTVANTSSPTSVDDWVRSLMAAIAKYADDTGGALVAGGSATALTVTTGQGLTGSAGQITNGLRLCVRTGSAATGAATIAVDSLTAVTILKNGGGAIAAGDWASGAILDLVYSSTATAFIAANIPGTPVASAAPSIRASFSVHKNGTNQNIVSATPTKVTFSTEIFDVGSYFASSTWTPPAGTVCLTAAIVLTLVGSDEAFAWAIYKNGSSLKRVVTSTGASQGGMGITIIDQCNGTDTYDVYIDSTSNTGYVVSGTATDTYFMGSMI